MVHATAAAPFQLSPGAAGLLAGRGGAWLCRRLERALGLPALNGLYEQSRSVVGPTFSERVLAALGVRIEIDEARLRSLPARGPLVVVANHPFGGLDGLILTALLQRVRPDARVLVNHLLARIPEMHATSLFVDPFGGSAATGRNRGTMKAALAWVAGGGALGVFPAGEVSHLDLRRGCVTDPPWSDTVARMALRSGATVVPFFFDGRNSGLFQVLGLMHARLRTAMLPRELMALRGRPVRVEIGTPIRAERLASLTPPDVAPRAAARDHAAQVTEYLRLRTYILKGRCAAGQPERRRKSARPIQQPIALATPAEMVAAEVFALPPEQCLAASGSMQAWYARAGQAPQVLREIGRLRERTFRGVGEGTGRALDLDRFDEHYLHLFVWNEPAQRVIGAYRIGPTDELLPRFGAAGLYTSTLFRYRGRLLEQLSPALELGRSFVVPEHQRDYAPLLLLWKGIGRFVARHPRYRRLFGAVSISDEFQSMTRQLLMSFLRVHNFDDALAARVRPRTPPPPARFPHADAARLATLVSDLSQVEELVSELESDRRGVPVLLRQYLKLNARMLGFNVDADFGNVVDGLVLVDLAKVERPVLNRYLGSEGAAEFLSLHATPPSRCGSHERVHARGATGETKAL